MDKRFSYAVEQVLLLSEEIARNMYHPVIGSEHLLLSILKFGNNILSNEINKKGIKYRSLHDKIKTLYKYDNVKIDAIKYSIELNELIEETINFSHKNKESSVSIDSLIFALINLKNAASDLLKSYGINIEFLSNSIIENKWKKVSNFGISDLHVMGKEHRDPLIGRDNEIQQIIYTLARRNKPNAILIGDPGVGKTAIVEEIAKRLMNDDIDELKGKIIFELDIASTLGGTKYRGEFEEKLKKIINKVKEEGNIILFIDEIHSIVKAGGAEGAIDASNIFKPYLARADIQIIGATTKEEFNESFEKDKALKRRFQIINILENTKEETKNIIKRIKKVYEEFYSICIDDEICDYVVESADKYLLNQKYPDKAIELLDNSCVRAKGNLSKEDVMVTLRSIFNIENIENKLYLFCESFEHSVFGQNHIKEQMIKIINQKEISVLLLGKKGVGKNKTISLLKNNVYHNDYITINSEVFCRKQNILSKGFEGEIYNELVGKLKDNPSLLVEVRNIDKADKETIDFFTKALKDGFIKDDANNKVSIINALFVFCVSSEFKGNLVIGDMNRRRDKSEVKTAKEVLGEPFVSSVNNILVFNELDNESSKHIIDEFIERNDYYLSQDKEDEIIKKLQAMNRIDGNDIIRLIKEKAIRVEKEKIV